MSTATQMAPDYAPHSAAPANDNLPATYEAYVALLPVEANKGCQINTVDWGGDPICLQNVAIYYRQKEEPWADAMAHRLDLAARSELRRVA